MAERNVGWGAPRIQGERLTLGFRVSEITGSRSMPKRNSALGSRQRGRTFLHNPLHETLAIDFAVVPTAGISGWRRTLLKNGLSKREETERSSRFLASLGCTLAIRESHAQLREPHPGT